jgi:hypothetical protein
MGRTANGIIVACYWMLVISTPLPCRGAQSKVFSSSEYGFRFQYPETWIRKPPRANPDARAKVSSNLADKANCYVVVQPEAEKAAALSRELLLAEVRVDFPDARLVDSGLRPIDGEPGNYIIVEMSYWSYDSLITIRNLTVRSWRDGQTFTLTCGAFKNWFKRYEPLFWDIVNSFEFSTGKQPPGPAKK